MGDGVHHVDVNDNDIGIDYTTAYDDNGNILQMQQWGLKLNTSSQIDNLYYHYQNNSSNKLQSVIDGNNDEQSKLGDFKTLSSHPQWPKNDVAATDVVDYTYDDNGNLALDNNKAISTISYNYLNLPYEIAVTGKGVISYQYDAAGNKLSKTTLDNSVAGKTVTTTTTYLGGTIYETKQTVFDNTSTPPDITDHMDELQFISTEEGRVRPLKVDPQGGFGSTVQSLAFDYFVKDHLGNVRAVLTDEVKVDKYSAATLEPAKATIENSYYNISSSQIVPATGLASTGASVPQDHLCLFKPASLRLV